MKKLLTVEATYLRSIFPGLEFAYQPAYTPLFEVAKIFFMEELLLSPLKYGYRDDQDRVRYTLEPLGFNGVTMTVELENLEVRYGKPLFMASEVSFEGPLGEAYKAYHRFVDFLFSQDVNKLMLAASVLIDAKRKNSIMIDVRREYEPLSAAALW